MVRHVVRSIGGLFFVFLPQVNAEYDCNPLLRMPLEDVTAEVSSQRPTVRFDLVQSDVFPFTSAPRRWLPRARRLNARPNLTVSAAKSLEAG